MTNESNHNVILFPKWKKNLQEKSLAALQQKDYKMALEKLNKLLSYNVISHEIIFGKLICLMELNQFDEAQDLCERQLHKKNPNYYDYVHLYLTILFQTDQHHLLTTKIKETLGDKQLPAIFKEQFQQLLKLSRQMNYDKRLSEAKVKEQDLHTAIEENDEIEQWRVIQQLQNLHVEPSEKTLLLLEKQDIHPVIKTAMFQWFQNVHIRENITVKKFTFQQTFQPVNIPIFEKHPIYEQGLFLIHKEQQKNPSMLHFLERLLYRYLYTRFPFMPNEEQLKNIIKAIVYIVEQTLHNDDECKSCSYITEYVEEIRFFEVLYLDIIDE